MKKFLALLLSLILIFGLTSCNSTSNVFDSSTNTNDTSSYVTVDNDLPSKENADYFTCIYTKEDYDAYISSLESLKTAVISGNNRSSVEKLFDNMQARAEFLSTQYNISNIVYYAEQTDEASGKYKEMDGYNTNAYAEYIKAHVEMYNSDSDFKDIIFADWTEQELNQLSNLDIDTFVRTKTDMNDILVEFMDLNDSSASWESDVNNLYYKHVKAANEYASVWGFDNFYDYMTQNEYCRDYSDTDRKNFRKYVKQYIVPLYYDGLDSIKNLKFTQADYNEFLSLCLKSYKTLNKNYVEGFINSFDGSIQNKMNSLFEGNRIKFGDKNSVEAAFTVRLDYYEDTVCYFGIDTYQSASTLVHELGHYISFFNYEDSDTSYDLLETHSQGTEWLFANYLKGEVSQGVFNIYYFNETMTLFELLIRCAIIDEFEETVYKAVTPYTADQYDSLLKSISNKYGSNLYSDFNISNYIKHIAIRNPVYYISYATSGLAAFDFYIICETDGYSAAQEAYRKLQECNPEADFSAALSYAGLSNPFKEQTFKNLVNYFQNVK